MDGRCISQNELAQRWQISEATLERWRSQRTGPMFLRLGGQVRYQALRGLLEEAFVSGKAQELLGKTCSA